ncbi:hypothetical protein ACHAXS_006667 [Conticribra weissflogii]
MVSGETQWEPPDVPKVDRRGQQLRGSAASNEGPSTPTATSDAEENAAINKNETTSKHTDSHLKLATTTTKALQTEESKPEKPKEDPATTAENFLRKPDAVMEPSVLDHITVLVDALGPQVAGPKAMQSLINGYIGDTAMCGLMGLWLMQLKGSGVGSECVDRDKGGGLIGSAKGVGTIGSGNTSRSKMAQVVKKVIANQSGKSEEEERLEQGADAARDVVEEVMNRLVKERFTKDGGDAIMNLSKKQAAFVDEMIHSERWRKLLIDLSAKNKDSKLFMYCLQSISKLGHHRAIANRINQSDYFGVFNSMLASELTIAGKVAVDGYSEEVSACVDKSKGQLGSLVADLRRTCASTSYTYLYATEVLNELITRTRKSMDNGGVDKPALQRARLKWQRLKEELEDEMLKPLATGTTFQKKRRIDVALTMSDLYQRQRRRIDPTSGHANGEGNGSTSALSNKNELANVLDTALVGLLTKTSLGAQIDKETAESMLKFAYGGSTDRIGDLLIEHPSAIIALLRNMFGSQRIRQLETRQKCARLAALAVMASERMAVSCDGVSVIVSDEDELCQIILKGSQLCEQVESMVSFTVLDSTENTAGSIGRQLSALCIKHAVIAQGVLIWAKELASGSEFITTAGYSTVSPCILSLARLISIYHPLARSNVLNLALVFLGHSNSDISHQKMQSIKVRPLSCLCCFQAVVDPRNKLPNVSLKSLST